MIFGVDIGILLEFCTDYGDDDGQSEYAAVWIVVIRNFNEFYVHPNDAYCSAYFVVIITCNYH